MKSDFLGQGAMATVYKCFRRRVPLTEQPISEEDDNDEKGTGEPFAVKITENDDKNILDNA